MTPYAILNTEFGAETFVTERWTNTGGTPVFPTTQNNNPPDRWTTTGSVIKFQLSGDLARLNIYRSGEVVPEDADLSYDLSGDVAIGDTVRATIKCNSNNGLVLYSFVDSTGTLNSLNTASTAELQLDAVIAGTSPRFFIRPSGSTTTQAFMSYMTLEVNP